MNNSSCRPSYSFSSCELTEMFRKLWLEHVLWTRSFIVSSIFNLEDIDAVTNRLLRNPSDFAALFKIFYGDDIAVQFESLLSNHLTIAGDLVHSAITNDSNAVAKNETAWYGNADEIATFLANINPYWSYEALKTMLFEHLMLTETEVIKYLNSQWEEGVAIFDEIEMQALMMADVFASGIIKQFYKMGCKIPSNKCQNCNY